MAGRTGANDDLTRSELAAQIHYRLVEQLSASERRYRGLVESLHDVVFQCDRDGRLVYVNPAWTRTLGYAADACLGRPLSDYVAPPDRALVRNWMAAAVPGDDARIEVRFVHAEGRLVVMDAVVKPETEGWTGSLHDETARHDAQTALRQAKESAERADRLKSEFLANMSHEIRTPMGAVMGFAECLLEPDLDIEERRAHVERIQVNGRHLLALVNDVLDLAQISADRLQVSPQPAAVGAILDEMEGAYGPLVRSRALEWTLVRDPQLPAQVVTDPHRLQQLLTILLDNALKFTRSGRIELSAQVAADHSTLTIAVTDTGVGIAAGELEGLFEPFHQVDGSATREHGGAGMGLAIARGIAEALGGVLQAESTIGQGSRFALSLPVRMPAASKGADDLSSVDGMRVLLAEDTPDMAVLTQRHLGRLGAIVTVAANGQEALALALEAHDAGAPYDLILMDMQMPVMDGYRATAELRRRGYSGRIAALTAHALPGDRERCQAVGCDDYVAKPADREMLRHLLVRHSASGASPHTPR